MRSLKRVVSGLLPLKTRNVISAARNSIYAEDGLTTIHVPVFDDDEKFRRAYDAGVRTGSWHGVHLRWRVHTACWAAKQVSRLLGDFVECGVNRGGISRAIMEYIDFNSLNKDFYLLDTYCGIPEAYTDKAASVNLSDYSECYASVIETFRQFPRAKIVRGIVPATLSEIKSDRIAYLHLDMNTPEPEIAAAKYLWDRIVSGGIMLLDDYCYSKHYTLQRQAFDKFSQAIRVPILALATGQGIIIKP